MAGADELDRTRLDGAALAAWNRSRPGAAAAHYARRGWPVVPIAGMVSGHCGCRRGEACEHPAKHPLTPGGIKAATTDQAQIAEWWAHWPWAGVGIVTGANSGLAVVDVDVAHGGKETLERLVGEGALSPTLSVRTGSDGWHLYYAHPGERLANATGRLGARELQGVDLRADGGYVVAPPSGHRSGRRYAWRAGDDSIVALPTWIVPRAAQTPAPSPALPAVGRDRLLAYAEAALEGECRRVAAAPEGLRNDTLNRAAFSLGTLVGAGVLDEARVVESLASAASMTSRSGERPLGATEMQATISSGLARGRQRPRGLNSRSSTAQMSQAQVTAKHRAPESGPSYNR